LYSVETGALRLSPDPHPCDILDGDDFAVLDVVQELVDQLLVRRYRRVFVPALGVIVHEGRVVLDPIVAREVVEAELAPLPEQRDTPIGQDVGERTGETVAFFEGVD